MKTLSHSRLIYIGLVLIALSGVISIRYIVPHTPTINEVAYALESGSDWIEIYNPSLNNISLEGMYLTDDKSDFTQYHITEQIIVPARGYTVVYAKDSAPTEPSLETNFRLSTGETVYLIASDGSSMIDSVSISTINESDEYAVMGRSPDGSANITGLTTETPGASNSTQ